MTHTIPPAVQPEMAVDVDPWDYWLRLGDSLDVLRDECAQIAGSGVRPKSVRINIVGSHNIDDPEGMAVVNLIAAALGVEPSSIPNPYSQHGEWEYRVQQQIKEVGLTVTAWTAIRNPMEEQVRHQIAVLERELAAVRAELAARDAAQKQATAEPGMWECCGWPDNGGHGDDCGDNWVTG